MTGAFDHGEPEDGDLVESAPACDIPKDKGERFVLMITGALAVWNVGIAFIVGVTAYFLNKRGWLRI